MEYSKLIITNLPAFYKVNLFNEINKTKKIYIIFTGEDSIKRDEAFLNQTITFDYINLGKLSKIKKIFKIIKIIKSTKYTELIIGGWNQIYYWLSIFISDKQKNALIIESSQYESVTVGSKGFIKRLFLFRINKVYASGESQIAVIKNLNFKGKIVKTKGVGLSNKIMQPIYESRDIVKNFLYVGRLSEEKNLLLLIEVFNNLPHLQLSIIGSGSQEEELKSLAKNNINFLGLVNNHLLSSFYQKNDVFILPSISEPWGLVVEEAMNNGLPVILSDKVGCSAEIVDEKKGLIFIFNDKEDLISKIIIMQNIDFYNNLRYNVSKINFDEIANHQIESYY